MTNYRAMLTEIPALVAEAEATRGTRPATPDGAHTRTVPGSRCLADLDRMIALSDDPNDGLGALTALVRVIIEEREESGETDVVWPWDDVLSVCWWLADQLEFINGRELFAEFVDDVARLHANLRRICQVHEPRAWPCMTPGCAGQLVVDERGLLRCEEGHDWGSLASWRNHDAMPATAAAERFGIDYPTLRKWRSRGKINGDVRDGTLYVWPWDVIRCRWPDLADLAA